MFAKTIIDSDAFIEMPQSTQLLYFHLSMRADDEGFVNNPRMIMRSVGCKEDDMKILIGKKFVLPFNSGVVVIKHWKIHNYIQVDRFKETKYKDEKNLLTLDENNAYRVIKKDSEVDGERGVCIEDVHEMDTQVRLGKSSLGKSSLGEVNKPLSESDEWFKEFWNIYPKKVQRKTSEQKFKINVKDELTFNAILLDLRMRVKSNDWTKDNGQFIPNPTTYLNQQRWEDETKTIEKTTSFLDMLREAENGNK